MADESKANRPAADRREIRVFISATFRDMQEERAELVKQIFPQLRRQCESRGVTWGEVDLRRGVQDEAKAESKASKYTTALHTRLGNRRVFHGYRY